MHLKLENSRFFLGTPTYDGSGQALHPDVIFFEKKRVLGRYRYVMVLTPYPFSSEEFENPSILFSNNGLEWFNEVENPIVRALGGNEVLSDPDIVYDGERFYLYYLRQRRGGVLFRKARALMKQYTKMYLASLEVVLSRDLVEWSKPRVLFSEGGLSSFLPNVMLPASPAVVFDGLFKMWYVKTFGCTNAGNKLYYRESRDGFHWGRARELEITLPRGEVLWHIDVQKLSNGYYWMVAACHPEETHCGDVRNLYLAYSSDGYRWFTYSEPILSVSSGSWDCLSLYRSTLMVYDHIFHLWYSGESESGEWHIGYTSCKLPNTLPSFRTLNVVR